MSCTQGFSGFGDLVPPAEPAPECQLKPPALLPVTGRGFEQN